MWEFVKIRDTKRDIDYGWMLKLSNWIEVIAYHETVDAGRASMAVSQIREMETKKKHFTDFFAAQAYTLAQIKNKSVVDILALLNSRTAESQFKVIDERGAIYINRNGGYFAASDSIEEYDWMEKKHLSWPTENDEDDIRIISYRGAGGHFYAKIGHTDVVVDGEQKWDTYDKAMEAGKTFLREG